MEGKIIDDKKKKIIVYGVIGVIVLIILIIFIAKLAGGGNKTSGSKKGKVNISYSILQTSVIGMVVNRPADEAYDFEIYVEYPSVNYDSEVINTFNRAIKKNVDDSIEEAINHKSTGKLDDTCEKIRIEKTGEEKYYDYFIHNTYVEYDGAKYLSIGELKTYRSDCAKSYSEILNTYVVDKEKKTVLYSEDLIKLVDKDSLLKYIEKNYNESYDEIKTLFENNKFFVYFNNDDELIVAFANPKKTGYSYYKYADKKWSNINDTDDCLYK